jgi:hypothetical protein
VNTGFAGAKRALFSVVYRNSRVFNGVEKKAWGFVQWWKWWSSNMKLPTQGPQRMKRMR